MSWAQMNVPLPVHAAFVRQRDQTGAPVMFPEQRTNGRFSLKDELLGHAVQLAPDGTSSGGPDQQELPLTQRPTDAWVNSHVEPRWGYALIEQYEGQPITFYPSKVVNPRVTPFNPWTNYPSVSRGHPIPYGDTVPVLGG